MDKNIYKRLDDLYGHGEGLLNILLECIEHINKQAEQIAELEKKLEEVETSNSIVRSVTDESIIALQKKLEEVEGKADLARINNN